jgi:hypothetical protein
MRVTAITTAIAAVALAACVGATYNRPPPPPPPDDHTCSNCGPFTFFAGHKCYDDYKDGVGFFARFKGLYGCDVDRFGNVLTVSPFSCRIRKVKASNGEVSTFLGQDCSFSGSSAGGPDGQGHPEAKFHVPR